MIVKRPSTKKPMYWKNFLTIDDNKVQVIEMLQKVWSIDEFTLKRGGRQVVMVCKAVAYLLTSPGGLKTESEKINTLTSTHEENYSGMILYCEYARNKDMKKCEKSRY